MSQDCGAEGAAAGYRSANPLAVGLAACDEAMMET